MINKGKVELISFNKTEERYEFEYSVEHNNGHTSVEQKLQIVGEDDLSDSRWAAKIALNEFPPQESPAKAALKLADWLDRLSSAIKSGEYIEIPKAKFKDLTNDPN